LVFDKILFFEKISSINVNVVKLVNLWKQHYIFVNYYCKSS